MIPLFSFSAVILPTNTLTNRRKELAPDLAFVSSLAPTSMALDLFSRLIELYFIFENENGSTGKLGRAGDRESVAL